MNMKNKSQIINDSDKKLSAVMADKEDVIIECKRQFFDITHTLNYPWKKWKC